jgi:hypothetical protein
MTRHPKYKKVKVLMPHCHICKEQLTGNNSIVSPWKCSCGTWKYNIVTFEYDVAKEKEVDSGV